LTTNHVQTVYYRVVPQEKYATKKASMTLQAIEFSIKVWKTQHQNPEFGPRQGEIQKNLQKSTLAFKGGETQKCTICLSGKLSFILF
jgi:hypothetical protein